MIVSWLILTGTAYDDFGFLRCFDCRPAACQLEGFGQNRGQQTNWHVAFDFGARVFGLCLIPFLPMPQGEVWVWVLGLGIVMMARGVFSSGEDRKLIPMAMVSACATAGYSLVDGLGARVMGDPLAYVS